MLQIPEVGIARSVERHNSRLDVAVDWIEGCVAFSSSTVSSIEAIDILKENDVYEDQDFASEFLADVWAELERRSRVMGAGSIYNVEGRLVRRRKSCRREPAYFFCLMLSLQAWYPKWARQFGADH